jgi:hypothetical protein
MRFTVQHNFPEVQRSLQNLHADIAGPATARALNRTIEPAKGDMAKQISKTYNLSASQVKDRLKITRARFYKGALSLTVSMESTTKKGRSLNLINFVEKSVSFAAARKRRKEGEGGSYTLRKGVTIVKALELRFKIKRTGPKKVIRGAFIANKGRTVFIREGRDRMPIKALQTIDVGQMFNTKTVMQFVEKRMFARFPVEWERQVRYYADRFNRGGSR